MILVKCSRGSLKSEFVCFKLRFIIRGPFFSVGKFVSTDQVEWHIELSSGFVPQTIKKKITYKLRYEIILILDI
jgi:hypothetical protein